MSPIWNCRARLAGRRAGSDVAVHPHDSPTNDLGWYHGRVELQPGGSSDPSARPNNGYGLVVAVVDGQDAGKRAELRCSPTEWPSACEQRPTCSGTVPVDGRA